ncbi:hypothetical protein IFU37_014930 [Pantoea agglomerans]|uniref:Uncharacterized protein n=1 Tax=Enterobacter agglomerans TaxID=549 RepID=A0ACC5PYC9_ENTAG|nr:hypothetical protein [Pantoea agglomerans]MBD8129160.1 hypothetical protein [Pantoea agglomerans]MBD8154864.1 hypothetical protein [Pantoea agglomerans]MBD8242523.1 hypothetical protein [Pantoea agglomerans]WVL84692.1 hypothetical protein IFU02_019820 [Pantoea agglomerans]WVL88901.1 hypothetical protein IFU37_014930 [Pantoea agglomerans]
MPEVLSLELAEYRSGLANTLFEILIDKAGSYGNRELIDLISLAYDINAEVNRALKAHLGEDDE